MTGSPTSADGTIDEFRIYPRTLTAADVLSVMAETRAHLPLTRRVALLLSHSGHGINCRVEPVTVYALDGLNGLVGTYSGATTLTTQSGRGTVEFDFGTRNAGRLDTGRRPCELSVRSRRRRPSRVRRLLPGRAFTDRHCRVPDRRPDHSRRWHRRTARVQRQRLHGDAGALTNPPPASINSPVATQTAGSTFPVYLTAYGQTPTDPQCGVIETYTGPHAAFVLERSPEPLAGRHECNRQRRYGGVERSCGHDTEHHVQPWPGSAFRRSTRTSDRFVCR